MSTVAAPRVSTCIDCGDNFEDLSRTSPRSYCDACKERRGKPKLRVISGVQSVCPCAGCERGLEVNTVEHFVAWAEDLTLDVSDEDGEPVPWVLEPFQLEIVADILSHPKEMWVVIPQGNAKTTLMAGVALYHGDHTLSPWVPLGAASRDQAEILFGQAQGFVERCPRLSERFKVFEGYRRIKCPTGGRGIRVYAADVKTGDGVIPTLAIVDELHRHDDLRLYGLWKGKLRKRNGQIVTISTAGEPGGVFEVMREQIRAKAVERRRDGCHLRAVGASLIYHEWMVPDVEQARDVEVVKDANPLALITEEQLCEDLASETLDFGEDWLRLTCNIPTRSVYAAVPEADWDACESEERIPEGQPVAVGADFAFMLDTTALVPFWAKSPTERFFGDPEIITPPRDGTILDPQLIRDAFQRIHERNPIQEVVMDTNRAEDIAMWLENEMGIGVTDRSQSNDFAALDYEEWMKAIRGRWFRHTGHQEFRVHVLNAVTRKLSEDRERFDRPSTSRNTKANRQDRRVVDALTAAAMVHSTVMRADEPIDVPLLEVL